MIINEDEQNARLKCKSSQVDFSRSVAKDYGENSKAVRISISLDFSMGIFSLHFSVNINWEPFSARR